MKSILMSIKPKWIEKITSGEKTVEVRKTVPKCGTPFKVYMYETRDGGHSCKRCDETAETCYSWAKSGVGCYNGRGKVVGEFVCDGVRPFEVQSPAYWYLMNKAILEQACLTKEELHDYIGAGNLAYGLHISDLKIYDKPKELSEFKRVKKVRGYHKSGENKAERLMHADRIKVAKITRPPQSWQYVEEQGVER